MRSCSARARTTTRWIADRPARSRRGAAPRRVSSARIEREILAGDPEGREQRRRDARPGCRRSRPAPRDRGATGTCARPASRHITARVVNSRSNWLSLPQASIGAHSTSSSTSGRSRRLRELLGGGELARAPSASRSVAPNAMSARSSRANGQPRRRCSRIRRSMRDSRASSRPAIRIDVGVAVGGRRVELQLVVGVERSACRRGRSGSGSVMPVASRNVGTCVERLRRTARRRRRRRRSRSVARGRRAARDQRRIPRATCRATRRPAPRAAPSPRPSVRISSRRVTPRWPR